MRLRLAAALLLAGLVTGLATACGSSTPTTTTAAHGPNAARWAAGLRGWAHGMRGALDGMSELFASPSAVRAIESADRVVAAKLVRYEVTLDSCTRRLDGLGPAPSEYTPSLRAARNACASLQRGSKLVKEAVVQFQQGLGSDLFSQSTQPLSDGQNDVEVATEELSVPAG